MQNNATQLTLAQVHFEHAGNAIFVTGANTSVDIIEPTTTVGGNTMYASLNLDSANPPASVSISSLLSAGTQFLVVDGITGNSIPPEAALPS